MRITQKQLDEIFSNYTKEEFKQMYAYALSNSTLQSLADEIGVTTYILRQIAKNIFGFTLTPGRPSKSLCYDIQ